MLTDEGYHRVNFALCDERTKVQGQADNAKSVRLIKYYEAQLDVLNMCIDQLAKDTRPLLMEMEETIGENEEKLALCLGDLKEARFLADSRACDLANKIHKCDGKIWAAKKVKKIVQRWQA